MTKRVSRIAAGVVLAGALLSTGGCVAVLAATGAGVAVDEANEKDGKFDPIERVIKWGDGGEKEKK